MGNRQRLRKSSLNTLHVSNCSIELSEVLDRLLEESSFSGWQNIYGDGQAGTRIVNLLATINLDKSILNKINQY